jgi:uncharacterized protein (DUF1800 family)
VARPSPLVEHLLRRAGFGLSDDVRERFADGVSYRQAVDRLVAYPGDADVDQFIGTPGYLGVTAPGGFSPNTNINHARQRWLFRMVHSPAPLLERMTLIWHHHFATAYSKVAGMYGADDGTRLMAGKRTEDATGQTGQIEMLRQHAFGSFETLVMNIALDPAMLVWLDGISNFKAKPQENFARELMELFTFGVGHFTESDVYAAARVFTGWNLTRTVSGGRSSYRFQFNAGQHDTDPKEFSFRIYSSRRARTTRTIAGRTAMIGMDDGRDLIHALAYHPETARRLARRFWIWFVSETEPATESFVDAVARTYLENSTSIRAVLRAVLTSDEFMDSARMFQRYTWPVEFVVRGLREVGHRGFSANDALTPLVNMGQQLFEPPDVNGWELGPAWFTTGGMLARMNFASQLATNQRVALRDAARPFSGSPDALVDFCYERLSMPPATGEERAAAIQYVLASGAWSGSDSQLLAKTAGVVHLLTGSAEYQLA